MRLHLQELYLEHKGRTTLKGGVNKQARRKDKDFKSQRRIQREVSTWIGAKQLYETTGKKARIMYEK